MVLFHSILTTVFLLNFVSYSWHYYYDSLYYSSGPKDLAHARVSLVMLQCSLYCVSSCIHVAARQLFGVSPNL